MTAVTSLTFNDNFRQSFTTLKDYSLGQVSDSLADGKT